jgi:hypothetical protein
VITPYVFNETSPAAAGTVASSAAVQNSGFMGGIAGPLNDGDALQIAADLQGATGGTLDIYFQISPDGGATWYDMVHFPQLTAGAAAVRYLAPVSLFTNLTTPVFVGKNLAPSLAVNTVVNGAFSDRCRLVFVAGAGTTVGAPVRIVVTPQRSYPRK